MLILTSLYNINEKRNKPSTIIWSAIRLIGAHQFVPHLHWFISRQILTPRLHMTLRISCMETNGTLSSTHDRCNKSKLLTFCHFSAKCGFAGALTAARERETLSPPSRVDVIPCRALQICLSLGPSAYRSALLAVWWWRL